MVHVVTSLYPLFLTPKYSEASSHSNPLHRHPHRSLSSIQPSITALVCQGETMWREVLQPKGISRLRQSAPQHSVV